MYSRTALAYLDVILEELELLSLADVIECPEQLVRQIVQTQIDLGGMYLLTPFSCYQAHDIVLDLQGHFMDDEEDAA
jgi:hypothetical protein